MILADDLILMKRTNGDLWRDKTLNIHLYTDPCINFGVSFGVKPMKKQQNY